MTKITKIHPEIKKKMSQKNPPKSKKCSEKIHMKWLEWALKSPNHQTIPKITNHKTIPKIKKFLKQTPRNLKNHQTIPKITNCPKQTIPKITNCDFYWKLYFDMSFYPKPPNYPKNNKLSKTNPSKSLNKPK